MHLSLDHSFDKNFFCLFCPRFYSSPKCLRIHIVRSHSLETKQSDEFLQENENFVSESETPNETVETFEKHLKIIQKIARGEAGDEVLLRVLSSSSVTLSNAFKFLDQFGSYFNLLFESIFQIIENSLAAPSELCTENFELLCSAIHNSKFCTIKNSNDLRKNFCGNKATMYLKKKWFSARGRKPDSNLAAQCRSV